MRDGGGVREDDRCGRRQLASKHLQLGFALVVISRTEIFRMRPTAFDTSHPDDARLEHHAVLRFYLEYMGAHGALFRGKLDSGPSPQNVNPGRYAGVSAPSVGPGVSCRACATWKISRKGRYSSWARRPSGSRKSSISPAVSTRSRSTWIPKPPGDRSTAGSSPAAGTLARSSWECSSVD